MNLYKKSFFVICMLMGFFITRAQEGERKMGINDSSVIFNYVESMPEFAGGEVALMKFLSSNISYPSLESDANIQGRVILKFVVDTTGKVNDVSITRSASPGLDAEAMRVVKMLPNFKPGEQDGKKVLVYYHLPIVFKLETDKSIDQNVVEKQNRDADFRAADLFIQTGKYTAAIQSLKLSIKKYPHDYLSYEYIGLCKFKLNNTKAACKSYKKALKNKSPTAAVFLSANCK